MRIRAALLAAVVVGGVPSISRPAVPPTSPAGEKAYRHPDLEISHRLVPAVAGDVAALGIGADLAFYDPRAGRLTSLILSEPMLPGVGNTLAWDGPAPASDTALGHEAWQRVLGYLARHRGVLRVDAGELSAPRLGVFENGTLIQAYAQRAFGGVPVRDSGLTAVVRHGNLVLLGLDSWGDAATARAVIGGADARAVVAAHAHPHVVEGGAKPRLEYVPLARGDAYEYRLAWVVPVTIRDDDGGWEGLVDAANGELLAFEDRNLYARSAKGGVYPVANDQRPPDGIEQPAWPMPRLHVATPAGTVTTNSSGSFGCVAGTASTALSGAAARITDTCGAIAETSLTGDLDLGFGPTPPATDCVVPPGHSAGDTKAARTAFYHVTRANEQASAYLPGNTWLPTPVPTETNRNSSCAAFWSSGSGILVFYRDNGAQCRNTGELPGVVVHEWGHGLDHNGVAPGVSNPGEGIADIHMFARLATTCVGRGFFKNQVCSGYGDQCDGTTATGCTGIRDIDFMNHRCDRPHTVSWITQGFTSAQCNGTGGAAACPAGPGPCGRAVHCEGQVVSETGFDLARRDLPAAGFDAETAHELTTRLFTLGSQAVTVWYTCAVGGGCSASGGYLQVLAADDDDGNLANGTPHTTAIRAAFERHEIHCATPAPVDSGCASGPTGTPAVTVTPGVESIALSWSAVPNAARYFVYRNDDVAGCDAGKVKIADVTGTAFVDTGLLGGHAYSYAVLPVGANTSCWGRASSCLSATPTADPCALAPDYAVSCSPSSMTTIPGGTGNSSCTVQSVDAFASAVTLGCTGLPVGATCAFVPNPVTPAPNGAIGSALTVSVGAGVPAGTYSFQATGTSGALTRTFPMTLTVIIPDFTLSCAPASLTVNQNASGNSTCTVQSQNLFASAVTMSCTGLPAGATCAYVPPAITPAPNGAATSALTVSVGGTVAPGTYNFQVRGTSGALVHTFDMTLLVTSLSVAPLALAVDPSGNGVYQPNELAQVVPTWRNTGAQAIAPTGVLSNHTGPAGPTYSIVDSAAGYGTIAVGGNASCGADCYVVQNTVTTRPSTHWDTTALETMAPTASTKTWTIHVGNSFAEVPASNPFFRFIEMLLHRGVTGGCTQTQYCPSNSTTREQMAVFVLLSKEPPGYVPPACVTGSEAFVDVPASSPFCRWIEELARRGVVSGCGGGNYCPSSPVSREQMSIFVLRTLDPTLTPPPCAPPNLYLDVPATSPFCRYIEELTTRGVVSGCGGGNYCPTASVTREQMGVFLAVTFGLTLYGI